MKKLILISIAICCAIITFAQTTQDPTEVKTPKKDYSIYFPKAGDFGLGIDAGQMINFIGGSIFGNFRLDDDGLGIRLQENKAIKAFKSDLFGKYFLTDKIALRARLGLGIHNFTDREFVVDDYKLINNPFSEAKTVDKHIEKLGGFEIGIGAEFRKSLWRLQGYIGAEVFCGYTRQKHSFEYGNPIADANRTPTTTWFNPEYDAIGAINLADNLFNADRSRILNTKNISTFTYGGGAFVGVDYFINRNISVGVEFEFQARASYMGEVKATTEEWRFEQVYTQEKLVKPATHNFNLQPITYLNLMFYF
ncbi:MAG: hypothetical protein LBV69_02135 [Bacteroidales bacterium]|jgi:hypothetical protein|nr:hypothetical protein [Bacteroidales bacterium]